MCTDAYREALIRDLTLTSSAPPATRAAGQCQAAAADREAVAGRPLRRRTNPGPDELESRGVAAAGRVADSGPAMALAEDATVLNGKVIDQR